MKSRRALRSVVLLLAALVTLLAVAAALLWLSRRGADDMHLQGAPMTDAQAAAQVLDSAKQIVRTAQLRDVTGGYAFVSCKNETEPPYQVAIYLNFRLPQGDSVEICATSRPRWRCMAGRPPRRWASTSARS
jgi:hypothetical protein